MHWPCVHLVAANLSADTTFYLLANLQKKAETEALTANRKLSSYIGNLGLQFARSANSGALP